MIKTKIIKGYQANIDKLNSDIQEKEEMGYMVMDTQIIQSSGVLIVIMQKDYVSGLN